MVKRTISIGFKGKCSPTGTSTGTCTRTTA
jgi:hypothetical protein